MPSMRAPLVSGAYYSVRELIIQFVRRVFEWRLVSAVGAKKAEPFLRDHRLWIRVGAVPVTLCLHCLRLMHIASAWMDIVSLSDAQPCTAGLSAGLLHCCSVCWLPGLH